MVNASLNWASIVGIVLAVGGALLYFMRSFKPALARDYDVFFAAIGLLCGGILFFQGWRLDPILQFGQFLLAGTTVFFAYESVRLRGVTTEQARRSSYFDDEEPLPPRGRGGLGPARDWDGETDRFDEPTPVNRRFRGYDERDDDFYRPRRSSRAAIPERAASRREDREDWESPRREEREPGLGGPPDRSVVDPSRYAASASRPAQEFGSRRRERDSGPEARRGSRPTPTSDTMPRSSRRPEPTLSSGSPGRGGSSTRFGESRPATTPGIPEGSPIGRSSRSAADVSDADFTPIRSSAGGASATSPTGSRPEGSATSLTTPPTQRSGGPRDNSSRFDD
ncbi:MAG: Ycf66 family protein [Synechococcaceae cyanobacterium]|nr:Ycf66 family protein [Synechococcaceae cyanobacterium]